MQKYALKSHELDFVNNDDFVVTVVEKLGKGQFGQIFKVVDQNNNYHAMKIHTNNNEMLFNEFSVYT